MVEARSLNFGDKGRLWEKTNEVRKLMVKVDDEVQLTRIGDTGRSVYDKKHLHIQEEEICNKEGNFVSIRFRDEARMVWKEWRKHAKIEISQRSKNEKRRKGTVIGLEQTWALWKDEFNIYNFHVEDFLHF
ncbi:hypothetical protein PIB30_028119 [Stylosanthes scabra]|uniref:Uncharacterized protein n=1 Tax=Stylosanthes scabra TaxID=79078 RepID=A0ABU6UAP3_9FABA|nr:hypothetical protein [Stylosanthes scabra]